MPAQLLQLWRLALALVVTACGNRDQPSTTPPTEESRQLLFHIKLSTDPSETKGPGGFEGVVYWHERAVSTLYPCRDEVERVAMAWAEQEKVTVTKRRPGNDGRQLQLEFTSEAPAGSFFLTYRTLTNIRLSGDHAGLRPLGLRLQQALQCVE
jgi:hypothetical protein